MKKNKIYIKSYGCQMNVYDSNRILDLFQNKILPGLKAFYETVLVPLGEVLMDLFGDLMETIGELFDNIGATVQKFKDGDVFVGIFA